jgi:hypothetical protein
MTVRFSALIFSMKTERHKFFPELPVYIIGNKKVKLSL